MPFKIEEIGVICPIGSVIAWLKSLGITHTPALPNGWVECNGQVLSDAGSPYNGDTIPNLNASGGGTKRFLRGSTTSGTTGGSDTVSGDTNANTSVRNCTDTGFSVAQGNHTHVVSIAYVPSYYEVVWIMKIK